MIDKNLKVLRKELSLTSLYNQHLKILKNNYVYVKLYLDHFININKLQV